MAERERGFSPGAGFIVRMPERISTAGEARRFVGYDPNQRHPYVLHIVAAIMMGISTFMKGWAPVKRRVDKLAFIVQPNDAQKAWISV